MKIFFKLWQIKSERGYMSIGGTVKCTMCGSMRIPCNCFGLLERPTISAALTFPKIPPCPHCNGLGVIDLKGLSLGEILKFYREAKKLSLREVEQKVKDYLFRQVVHSLAGYIIQEEDTCKDG